MYEILQIVRLRLTLMLRDKMFLLLLVFFPVLFVLILGATQSFQKQSLIPVALVDQDKSEYSSLIAERFAKKEGLRVIRTSEQEARRLVESYGVEVAFLIKPGFQNAILQENAKETIEMMKNPGSLSYGIIGEMLGSEVMRLTANAGAANKVKRVYSTYHLENGDPATLWDRAWKYTDSQWEPEPLLTVAYREEAGAGPVKVERTPVSTAALTGAGMLLVFLMLFVIFHSSWLIEERNNGTLKRMMAIPGLLLKFYIGNALALLLQSVLLVALCAGLSSVLFDAELFLQPFLYLILVVYMFAVIALGMFFSSIFKTSEQLQAGAPLLSLLTGFIGGCFWAFIEPSSFIKTLSLFTPQGWALQSIQELMMNDYQPVDLFLSASVLTGVGIILFLYSFWRIRKSITI